MTSNVVETRLARSNTSRPGDEAERPTAAAGQLSRAKRLAESLLSERGEASGAVVARELREVLRILVAEDRADFQRFLATDFAPDATIVRAAAEAYLSDPSAEAAALLAQATDPPRQELLRRMNMAPGGTSALVAMHKEIAGRSKVLYAVQEPFQKLCSRARRPMRPGGRSRVSTPFRRRTGRSIPISNASWPSAWAPRPSK
jgi:Malonyl-CoA decarboxylase N-terminal domain